MHGSSLRGGSPKDLFSLDAVCWSKGVSVHAPVADAALSWMCGPNNVACLVVLPDSRLQGHFCEDRETLFEDVPVFDLRELPLTTEGATNRPFLVQRGELLRTWRRKGGFLAATPGSLMGPVLFGESQWELHVGHTVDREEFLQWLLGEGYRRVDLVWAPGQIALRGSIIDVFDPIQRFPVRIELFDDTLESLRHFSPEDQRSVANLSSVFLQGISSTSAEHQSLFSELPSDLSVLFVEPKELEKQGESYLWLWDGLREQVQLPPLPTWQSVYLRLSSFRRLRLSRILGQGDLRWRVREVPSFRGRWDDVEVQVAAWREHAMRIHVYSASEIVLEWAKERGLEIRRKPLSRGFVDDENAFVVLTDTELSGVSPTLRRNAWYSVPREWKDRLLPGEFVIHEEYGVAVYRGMQALGSGDNAQEYMVLEFANEKRLLVPMTHFPRITSHAFSGETPPRLDSLKGSTWKKALERARERTREAAEQLVRIYAEREFAKGFSFPPDGEMLSRFERAFPFDETADQLKAIRDVKRDMESPLCMDRLVVGDVGFGKTEVALRAAMKAVESGKQVAVLVPTTVLAQQHFATFTSRFQAFPVSVACLSRFVGAAQGRRIVEGVRKGQVDILIGTHRLFLKDLVFKDLGLLVIDEEHRFGVLHKENLKERYPCVDVLTLSATPIPRTLQLSLQNLRSISLITTPPRFRHPVISIVSPWNDDLVKKVILRELARGGQVFFVHNRISTITRCVRHLRNLLPEARFLVAHGRMPDRELEQTMLAFAEGEADILVCTTIIESGLDMPRANTLIVDNAQDFGLAQLYQLRGRVGRRNEQAFAFFLHPEGIAMTRESTERLDAIGSLDALGMGYQLAEKDLQIRGGGDLFGPAQHGHIERIGFHLYCSLLEKHIARIRGIEQGETRVEMIDYPGIPASYIPQEGVRITLYRRLLRAGDVSDLSALEEETKDRFGSFPESVGVLFALAKVRVLGTRFGVQYVRSSRERTSVSGNPEAVDCLASELRGWKRRAGELEGPGAPKGVLDLEACLEKLSGA
ncbi:transcription-repair coupling factor [Aminiphilus circumscriptus]|uniref:transcription-repair coupling factor n=1 Tax=Aminiphilus circumscriptus TaxID=290732 RepID=UPI0004B2E855|nr:DEAD/DEAH box helicase [Aminiphilus circumscriptus]